MRQLRHIEQAEGRIIEINWGVFLLAGVGSAEAQW